MINLLRFNCSCQKLKFKRNGKRGSIDADIYDNFESIKTWN